MKCLVTKLNGTVNNDSLLKLGEVKFKFNKVANPTSDTRNFYITVNKPTTLKINGGGFFTDKNLIENKGDTLTIDANSSGLYFVSNNDVEISVIDKYNLTSLRNYDNIATSGKEDYSNKFKDFDLSDIICCTALESVLVVNTSLKGDIKYLCNLPKMNYIMLNNTSVSGDIASFSKLVNLTNLNVSNTSVSGDIASFSKLVKLTSSLLIENTFISGDLGTLPDNIKWVRCSKDQNFTWTTTNRTKILAMQNVKCDKIDNLLKDLADKEADFTGEQGWYKTISLIGTRTSASDAAVQALQSKGYTVSITPA